MDHLAGTAHYIDCFDTMSNSGDIKISANILFELLQISSFKILR